jgi:hypothetical protein
MKAVSIILIFLGLCSCGTSVNNTKNTTKDSVVIKQRDIVNVVCADNDSVIAVDSVLNIIYELDEVVNLEKRYKNINGNKSIILSEYPNDDFNYFWVQVGFSNEIRFETIYNFYLTPKNYSVYFYNTENDTIIRLADWRELRGW